MHTEVRARTSLSKTDTGDEVAGIVVVHGADKNRATELTMILETRILGMNIALLTFGQKVKKTSFFCTDRPGL